VRVVSQVETDDDAGIVQVVALDCVDRAHLFERPVGRNPVFKLTVPLELRLANLDVELTPGQLGLLV
jgi:hypothetical protein